MHNHRTSEVSSDWIEALSTNAFHLIGFKFSYMKYIKRQEEEEDQHETSKNWRFYPDLCEK
jgi:disulfide oxidoreductase YuzD